jgi:hypothetical protein
MKIPLDPPFKYEDYDLNEIDLDLTGKMTPRKQEACEGEFRRMLKGDIVPVPWIDSRFRLIVASKITGIPMEVLLELPIEPYNIIHNTISYFFANSQEPSTEMPLEGDTEQ